LSFDNKYLWTTIFTNAFVAQSVRHITVIGDATPGLVELLVDDDPVLFPKLERVSLHDLRNKSWDLDEFLYAPGLVCASPKNGLVMSLQRGHPLDMESIKAFRIAVGAGAIEEDIANEEEPKVELRFYYDGGFRGYYPTPPSMRDT